MKQSAFLSCILTIAIAIATAIWSSPSLAIAGCDEGGVGSGLNPLADPESNRECVVMGRAFCQLSISRAAGVPEKAAIEHSASWFSHLDQRGTHITVNYSPVVSLAAQYVYSHDAMLPWTSYFYGVYTCGVSNRIRGDMAEKQKRLAQWESSAADCRARFPGKGVGAANDELRQCLISAMGATSK